jgi:hypothetical protein
MLYLLSNITARIIRSSIAEFVCSREEMINSNSKLDHTLRTYRHEERSKASVCYKLILHIVLLISAYYFVIVCFQWKAL